MNRRINEIFQYNEKIIINKLAKKGNYCSDCFFCSLNYCPVDRTLTYDIFGHCYDSKLNYYCKFMIYGKKVK